MPMPRAVDRLFRRVSTYSESIGYFNSSAIELVAGAFHYYPPSTLPLYFVALAKRSLKPLFSNTELCFYFAVAALIIGLVFFEVGGQICIRPQKNPLCMLFPHQLHADR